MKYFFVLLTSFGVWLVGIALADRVFTIESVGLAMVWGFVVGAASIAIGNIVKEFL